MNNPITQWPCPAKLNLNLQIVGQREDGYHNLQSVFQIVDYADTLDIQITSDPSISFDCDQKSLAGNDNLVVAAATKLRDYAKTQLNQTTPGAMLYLHKKLPVGGGVGGGSSNCATALVALNRLWQLNLSLDTLTEIGLSLGADVPIFIQGKSAFVEGIGEIITPVTLPDRHYLVIQPRCHISTAKIFSNPLLTRNSKAITIRDLNVLGLPDEGVNSMQEIVYNDYPEVAEALDWLKQFNKHARMTGSGSCVFAAFDNELEMSTIASRCEWPHFMAKGVNTSPLHIDMLN